MVSTVDYHVAGAPFRIVAGGVGRPVGHTMMDKRRWAMERLDHVRRLLAWEPRGHAAMDGCLVTDPVDDGADFGVVFFETAGYSTACGHGTIAVVTWALESGLIPADDPETQVVVDVPSGRVRATARVANGAVESVRFENVSAFVHSDELAIPTASGTVTGSVAYGGAFYVSVDAAVSGVLMDAERISDCITLAREIKSVVEAEHEIAHPLEPELRGIYGVTFFREEESRGGELTQRNVTVFGDGTVDRSPCGSGTSARLALLHASGRLAVGDWLLHLSVIGTEFRARITGETTVGDTSAVVTEIEGHAHLTGFHQFALRRDDPLGPGFNLG